MPAAIETYYEPFAGSAAVFFALAAEGRFRRAVLSDQNRELVNVYRTIKRDVNTLIGLLETTYHHYDRDEYYRIRELEPANLEPAARAARFIYLNKTGYNGLYRVNRAGRFNVPFGRYKDPTICDRPRLMRAHALLKRVKLEVSDFEHCCAEAKRGDVVYFDPPYVPLSATSNFTAYHSDAFDEADHERLARLFGQLAGKNVLSVLSNSDTQLTRKLYRGFDLKRLLVKRPINSKSDSRGHVGEILVVNRKT
jgi:DNA adenine methylase